MDFYQAFLLEQTVWIPVTLCIYRFKDVKPKYIPLLLYLVIYGLLELIGNLVVKYVKPMPVYGNTPFYNLMFLVEAILVTWLFYSLGALKSNKKVYIFFQMLWIVLWVIENFFISTIFDFNLMLHATYSCLLIGIIVAFYGRLVITIKNNIYRNADFWISNAFALWFIYSVFYSFSNYIVAQNNQLSLAQDMIEFREITEVILYLLLSWAIICIPRKRSFY
jgi:hypothetical protein